MKFFDRLNEPAKRKQRTKTSTVALEREEVPFELFTDEELYAAKGGVLVADVECYPNYWMVGFRCFHTDKIVYFERTETQSLDIPKLLWVLHSFTIVGFNSNNYDIPIIWLAMQGVDNATLKHVSDFIIRENWRLRDIEAAYKFKAGSINSLDLIEVAPLSASLKAYAARLHAPRLQELPFSPETALSPSECVTVRNYNFTDLEDTLLLLRELCPQLELRAAMSLQYGQDLRSKSDAQIAEHVLCGEIRKLNGYWAKRPTINPGTVYKYQVPNFVQYKTPLLQKMLEIVRNADFVIAENGQVLEPVEFSQLKALNVGYSTYKMGLGGLHSTEERISHVATDKVLLISPDVASYYPRTILNQRLFPKHLTNNFLNVYQSLVEKRLRAKAEAKNIKQNLKDLKKLEKTIETEKQIVQLEIELKEANVICDSIKVSINGSFGKLGSKYSTLYSPDLLLQVTISGQLCLLMLIESIELAGIPVISGNTDGIIVKCNTELREIYNNIVKEWERITNYETEEECYKSVYSRDVNNFIIVKEDGMCKVKGCYSEKGSALNSRLSKNPEALICSEAVQALLTKQTPIEETIRNCKDITKFVSVIKVTGGGEKDGVYLGKTVRHYYAKGIQGCISRVANGNKVPNTDGAKPCQDLSTSFPNDVNFEKYIEEANKILVEVGFTKTEKQLKFF